MGIALGYAFLVAIAGGIAAICVAQYLEMAEEERQAAPADSEPAHDRLLYGVPSIVPSEASLRRLSRPVPARTATQFSLTAK